ncbi:MAG: hypothetical protein PHZ04_00155 [Patescibacteria group bacterium]|nr:hypothetical protein [Patescibacteria group bacterium]MDD5294408.1 hypothetical protein [Patescibacteria group bacterium]MDD5554519.1 hypothetical protein [Patescibacteria group bacterium]
MNKQNYSQKHAELERRVEERYKRVDKRKRPKMRVSGTSVRNLQRLIIKK